MLALRTVLVLALVALPSLGCAGGSSAASGRLAHGFMQPEHVRFSAALWEGGDRSGPPTTMEEAVEVGPIELRRMAVRTSGGAAIAAPSPHLSDRFTRAADRDLLDEPESWKTALVFVSARLVAPAAD